MSGKATAEASERGEAADETPASSRRVGAAPVPDDAAPVSFLRRYRLPLVLAFVALCLYVGSILYILLGRGQIA